MSEATASIARIAWKETDGLYQEPRLIRIGVRHGLTHQRLGNMKDPVLRTQAAGAQVMVHHQVHGTEIHDAASFLKMGQEIPDGDGWISAAAGVCIGVHIADCQPVYLWEHTKGKGVGIFHAGWRGTAAGMGRAAVEAMGRLGIEPERLAAAVGPHIGPCCYRIGRELVPRFKPESLRVGNTETYLDLAAETAAQLLAAGLRPEHITLSKDCTACRGEEFFSYRRDKVSRSMLAFIGVPA